MFSMSQVTVSGKHKNNTIKSAIASVRSDARLTGKLKDSFIHYIVFISHTYNRGDELSNMVIGEIDSLLAYCCDKSAVLVSKIDTSKYEKVILDYIDVAERAGGITKVLDGLNSDASIDFRDYMQKLRAQKKNENAKSKGRHKISGADLKDFLIDVGVEHK